MKKNPKRELTKYREQDPNNTFEPEIELANGMCCDVCEIASCDVGADCCCSACTGT